MSNANENAASKAPRTRSPNYPAINLQAAVRKLPDAFQAMRRHSVGVESAVKALGLSYTSSSGKLALAAMRSFGLFEDDDRGMVKLSKRALDLIDFKEDEPEWRDAVIGAAKAPNMHKKLLDRYEGDLPSDDELRRYLIREEGFNDNTVGLFIDQFKKTIAFAGLAQSDREEKNEEQSDERKPREQANATAKGKDMSAEAPPGKGENVVVRDFPIPLISGGIAVVKVPVPMSELDFTQLTGTLQAWKAAQVRAPETETK